MFSKTIGNLLIYFMLSFAAPAIGAMRMLNEMEPTPVVLILEDRPLRNRMLLRRYGIVSHLHYCS